MLTRQVLFTWVHAAAKRTSVSARSIAAVSVSRVTSSDAVKNMEYLHGTAECMNNDLLKFIKFSTCSAATAALGTARTVMLTHATTV